MAKKEKITLSEREKAQNECKRKITHIISGRSLRTAELQVEYLEQNKKALLPTILNHKETVRIYWLTIEDYKKKLEKKQLKNNEKENGN